MTTLTWLMLGLGLAALPLADPSVVRVRALGAGGRLAPVATRRPELRGVSLAGVIGACGAVASVAVLAVGGPLLALAAALAAGTAAWLVSASMHARQVERDDATLVSALRLMAAELAAGGAPAAAFDAGAAAGGACAETFAGAARACARGHDPPLALPALDPVRQAWTVSASSGAPLAAVMARVAADAAARLEGRRRIAAALAGARSSAVLLAVLPVLGVLLGAAMGAHPVAILLLTPAGQVLCVVGVALDAAGVLWTHRLTRHATVG